MPVTVVVGGQFGGEGKGKVAHYLAREMGAKVAVRVGGSNSGHTVIDPAGNALILRQLPTPSILTDVTCVLGRAVISTLKFFSMKSRRRSFHWIGSLLIRMRWLLPKMTSQWKKVALSAVRLDQRRAALVPL